jgi:hypothetical protein
MLAQKGDPEVLGFSNDYVIWSAICSFLVFGTQVFRLLGVMDLTSLKFSIWYHLPHIYLTLSQIMKNDTMFGIECPPSSAMIDFTVMIMFLSGCH